MNSKSHHHNRQTITAILPTIFRITLSLLLWTLGAASMNLASAQTQPKEHHVVVNFPVDRDRIENLQRWVNTGHDPWCRDPQLVAAAALRQLSPRFSEFEMTSLPVQLERSQKTKAIYTFHSIDGSTTYRLTLRRYPFLRPTPGSLHKIIWVPERAEILTRDIRE